MNIFRTLRNYFFYCGIEKDEYNALKKDAYVSNFKTWRVLHFLMAAVFGLLFAFSFASDLLALNRVFYLIALLYSVAAILLFGCLRKDSITAQLLIYLSISMLFLFGCVIAQNRPDSPAVSFIAFLLITPMFMIDKPFFMAFELGAAAAVFLIWMHGVKPYNIWRIDFSNVVTFTAVGIFLNIIANAIRIKEFVLTREINLQKDTDEMTGLRNKGALTREINEYLMQGSAGKGFILLLDIDQFKSINDTYGHDVGDSVISQFGGFLSQKFTGNEIVGRFGGDEFIIFIKDADNPDTARRIAEDVISGAAENVVLPDKKEKIGISIGIAACNGTEHNYSEVFKRADTAMYRSKADPENRIHFCE